MQLLPGSYLMDVWLFCLFNIYLGKIGPLMGIDNCSNRINDPLTLQHFCQQLIWMAHIVNTSCNSVPYTAYILGAMSRPIMAASQCDNDMWCWLMMMECGVSKNVGTCWLLVDPTLMQRSSSMVPKANSGGWKFVSK